MTMPRCSTMLRLRNALQYPWWELRTGEYRPAQLDHYRLRTWHIYRCTSTSRRSPCPTMERRSRYGAHS